MRTSYSLALRIILALALGFLLVLYSFQNDNRCKSLVERELQKTFGLFFDCQVIGTVQSINILSPSPSIVTTNVRVKPKHGHGWKWECSKFVLSISWYDILFGSKIGVKSDIYSLKATSSVQDGNLCIMDHVQKVMKIQRDFPFELRMMQIHKGSFVVHSQTGSWHASCAFDGEVRKFNKRLQTVFYITDGTMRDDKNVYIADAGLHISHDTQPEASATLLNGMVRLPLLDEASSYYFQGSWKDKLGSLRVYNKNGSFVVDQCGYRLTDTGSEFSGDAHFPLNYLSLMLTTGLKDNIQGTCHVRISGAVDESTRIQGKVHLKNITVADYFFGDMKANAVFVKDQLRGVFTCSAPQLGNPSGTYEWSMQQNKGSFQIQNALGIEQIPNRYWNIASRDLVITGTFDERPSLSAQYRGQIVHSKLDTQHAVMGNIKVDEGGIQLEGNIDDVRYLCQTTGMHNFHVKNISVQQSDKDIVSVLGDDAHVFHGVISYDGVRSLAKKLFDYDAQGEGTITVQGKWVDNGVLTNMTMKKGNVRIGSTYNFIQKFDGIVKALPNNKELSLKNWSISLHRGNLLIPYARCLFDEQQRLDYCYIPLHLRNVFLNNERDVFMLVSGRLVVIKQQGARPIIKGRLCIDRGQIRHNIFSAKEQKNILKALSQALIGSSQDIEFDVTIDTKHPVHVKTAFLESEIKLQLSVQGSLQHPQVSGKILIPEGTFHFPYRPLKISRGILYVMPHNLEDPAIELHAKGRVKRYTVNMYVHGTLLDPHVTFASTPPLAQEQIITLLLGGSETGALGLVMPSLVMQNVQNLVFGSGQVSPGVEKYILSPLRYIRIVPSFTDQAGRGGFRGAIEIDVTDQLRAVIQKNFSLSEDTRFEVEYQVSDEISLRGIKDERSDIGGEIEARFTF